MKNKLLVSNLRKIGSSYDVKVGDIIEIQMGENLLKAEVLIVTEHATKNDAGLMYKII